MTQEKPNEIIPISAESLEIAQTYIKTQSIQDTAIQLGIAEVQVTQYLSKPEVRNYVDMMYLNAGYRNRNKIAEALDRIIDQKLKELEDAEVGSSKDILELLQTAHKMRMDELKVMAEMEKARQANSPKNQTNIQINESPFGAGNYGKLLDQLLTVPKE